MSRTERLIASKPARMVLKPGEMSREHILDQFHWTDDDLARARGFAGFPEPGTRYIDAYGDVRSVSYWREREVADWFVTVKNLLRNA